MSTFKHQKMNSLCRYITTNGEYIFRLSVPRELVESISRISRKDTTCSTFKAVTKPPDQLQEQGKGAAKGREINSSSSAIQSVRVTAVQGDQAMDKDMMILNSSQ